MSASERSLRITDAYRQRLQTILRHAEARTRQSWRRVDLAALETSFAAWATAQATRLSVSQTIGVRLTNAYLAAFLSSELGSRVSAPIRPSADYTGRSRDGRSFAESLPSVLVGVLAAIKGGEAHPLDAGLLRAVRAASLDVLWAPRKALSDAMAEDGRIAGWRRVTRPGACGACLGLAHGIEPPTAPLHIHADCECTAEPVVKNVPDRHPRPTGAELFASLTEGEQDQAVGPEVAPLVRAGEVSLAELVGHSPMKTEPDWVTQKPLDVAH